MLLWKHFQEQRGVYMTMGRISRRREFTPVPSRGSVFVYMIPSPRYLTKVNPSVEAFKTDRVSHHNYVMPARVSPA